MRKAPSFVSFARDASASPSQQPYNDDGTSLLGGSMSQNNPSNAMMLNSALMQLQQQQQSLLRPAQLTHEEQQKFLAAFRDATQGDHFLTSRGFPDLESALVQLFQRADVHIPLSKLKLVMKLVAAPQQALQQLLQPGHAAVGRRASLAAAKHASVVTFDDQQQQQMAASAAGHLVDGVMTKVSSTQFLDMARFIKAMSRQARSNSSNNGSDDDGDDDGQVQDPEDAAAQVAASVAMLTNNIGSNINNSNNNAVGNNFNLSSSMNSNTTPLTAMGQSLTRFPFSSPGDTPPNKSPTAASASSQQQQQQQQQQKQGKATLDATVALASAMNESTASHPFFSNTQTTVNTTGGGGSSGDSPGSLSQSLSQQEFANQIAAMSRSREFSREADGDSQQSGQSGQSNSRQPPQQGRGGGGGAGSNNNNDSNFDMSFGSMTLFRELSGGAGNRRGNRSPGFDENLLLAATMQSSKLRARLRQVVRQHKDTVSRHRHDAVLNMRQSAATAVSMQQQLQDGTIVHRGPFAVQHTRFNAFHFSPPLAHQPDDLPLFVKGKPMPMKIRDIEERHRIAAVRRGEVEGAGRSRCRCRTCTPDVKPSRFDIAASRTVSDGSGVTTRFPPVNGSLKREACSRVYGNGDSWFNVL